jgi:hypothetical protein
MTDKATPGPWVVIEFDGSYVIQNNLIDQDSGALMYDPIVWEMGGIDNVANAHLLAAAPDLLASSEAQSALIRDLLNLIDPKRRTLMRERLMKISEQAFAAHQKARGTN